jgi:hypothetical protein
VNILILRALLHLHEFYEDEFTVEHPTGSGTELNLREVAAEIGNRLTRIFLRDDEGRRPVYGGNEVFQNDPYWRDLLLFYEYFHGDDGAGLGASHQTGWTGLVAVVLYHLGELGTRGLGSFILPAERSAVATPSSLTASR